MQDGFTTAKPAKERDHHVMFGTYINTFKYTDLSYLTTWGVTVPHIHAIHSSMQCRNIFRGALISAISLAGR